MKKLDLLTFGEVLLRLSPEGNERLTQGDHFMKRVGGAELNVAAGASMLGLSTGIISRIPAHAIGNYAKSQIQGMGVSTEYLLCGTMVRVFLQSSYQRLINGCPCTRFLSI